MSDDKGIAGAPGKGRVVDTSEADKAYHSRDRHGLYEPALQEHIEEHGWREASEKLFKEMDGELDAKYIARPDAQGHFLAEEIELEEAIDTVQDRPGFRVVPEARMSALVLKAREVDGLREEVKKLTTALCRSEEAVQKLLKHELTYIDRLNSRDARIQELKSRLDSYSKHDDRYTWDWEHAGTPSDVLWTCYSELQDALGVEDPDQSNLRRQWLVLVSMVRPVEERARLENKLAQVTKECIQQAETIQEQLDEISQLEGRVLAEEASSAHWCGRAERAEKRLEELERRGIVRHLENTYKICSNCTWFSRAEEAKKGYEIGLCCLKVETVERFGDMPQCGEKSLYGPKIEVKS